MKGPLVLPEGSQHVRAEESAWSDITIIDDPHQGDAVLRRDEVRDLSQQIAGHALQEVGVEVHGEPAQAGEEEDLVGVQEVAEVAAQIVGGVGGQAHEDLQRRVDARDRLAGEGDGEAGTSEVVLRGEECREERGLLKDSAVGDDGLALHPVHNNEVDVVAIGRSPIHQIVKSRERARKEVRSHRKVWGKPGLSQGMVHTVIQRGM